MTDGERDENPDAAEGVRISDLEPSIQRIIEQLRQRPPGHRRNLPDPENPSRPELEVLSRIRTKRAAVEQRES
jgi:hypothetical protein